MLFAKKIEETLGHYVNQNSLRNLNIIGYVFYDQSINQ